MLRVGGKSRAALQTILRVVRACCLHCCFGYCKTLSIERKMSAFVLFGDILQKHLGVFLRHASIIIKLGKICTLTINEKNTACHRKHLHRFNTWIHVNV